MKQHDIIPGFFRPKIMDDLPLCVQQYIGKSFDWKCDFFIMEGHYRGQWAMVVCHERNIMNSFWFPAQDIETYGHQDA